jgi:hypothetical protein
MPVTVANRAGETKILLQLPHISAPLWQRELVKDDSYFTQPHISAPAGAGAGAKPIECMRAAMIAARADSGRPANPGDVRGSRGNFNRAASPIGAT